MGRTHTVEIESEKEMNKFQIPWDSFKRKKKSTKVSNNFRDEFIVDNVSTLTCQREKRKFDFKMFKITDLIASELNVNEMKMNTEKFDNESNQIFIQ